MKIVSNIGKRIDESGLRTELIAKTLGVTDKQVYNLKKGICFPSFERAFLLAKLIDCKVDDLAEIISDEQEKTDTKKELSLQNK